MDASLARLAVSLGGTFDFDLCQLDHPWFRALVAGKGGSLRVGLCGALTLEWLRWRKQSSTNRTDFPAYVCGTAVAEWIRVTVNRIAGGATNDERVAVQAAVMRSMGFRQQGLPTAFSPVKFDRYVQTADFGAISIFSSTASHLVGLYIPNNGNSITGVHFFDSNEGGVSFPNLEAYFKWWKSFEVLVASPMLKAAFNYRLINYVPSSP